MRRLTLLRLLRLACDRSLTDLSEGAGIEISRLSRIERGLVQPAEFEVRRIFRALGPEAAPALEAAIRFREALAGNTAPDEGPDAGRAG